MSGRVKDLLGVLKGIQLISCASVRTQEAYLKQIWSNSSIRDVLEQNVAQTQNCTKKVLTNPLDELKQISKIIQETIDRSSAVLEGVRHYNTGGSVSSGASFAEAESETSSIKTDLKNLDIASITLKELENLLSEHSKNREVSLRIGDKNKKEPEPRVEDVVKEKEPPVIEKSATAPLEKVETTSAPTSETKPPIPKPEEIPAIKRASEKDFSEDEKSVKNMLNFISNYQPTTTTSSPSSESAKIVLPELKVVAKQRKVPSSRISRVASFGSLFAGLGVGTLNELAKGAVGLGGTLDVREALLSPKNAERIVDTLCKVRGAALKLGQILSIQDSNVVSPQLVKAFDRVRQSADYMPDWQLHRQLVAEFGKDWRSKFASFDDKPFAAASIGQVHRGVTHDGVEVAIKIQYPGVAESIESDIDNLVSLLKVWNVFPAGIFIDNIVTVAKRELAWEVDYLREAEYTENFGKMIQGYPQFRVPKVFMDLSTKRVLTTELVPGVPMDSCFNLSEEERNHIARMSMQLCMVELFELKCMQTDPNWSNFLYDQQSRKLMLIDFGATRFYSKTFMDNYLKVIIAATEGNREKVIDISRTMGFLTGYETPVMEKAHVDAVMILGEVFSVDGAFDFGHQQTTKKIADLVPVMIAHRLCPPPEEIYSLHRKLSGVFLLCHKLNAKIACKPIFMDIVDKYKFD